MIYNYLVDIETLEYGNLAYQPILREEWPPTHLMEVYEVGYMSDELLNIAVF